VAEPKTTAAFTTKLSKRSLAFYHHFEQLAAQYARYKKRFSYYWNDIIHYCNYFIHPEDSVIEIGCGNGDALSKLKGSRKVGIDFSPAMIQIAKETHPSLTFHQMDAADITLDEKFDVVILSNAIGYFDNVEDVMLSMRAICHDRTKIIITYYNQFWEPLINLDVGKRNIGYTCCGALLHMLIVRTPKY